MLYAPYSHATEFRSLQNPSMIEHHARWLAPLCRHHTHTTNWLWALNRSLCLFRNPDNRTLAVHSGVIQQSPGWHAALGMMTTSAMMQGGVPVAQELGGGEVPQASALLEAASVARHQAAGARVV